MFRFKFFIKNILRNNQKLYNFILFFWKIINLPKNYFSKKNYQKIKEKSFKEFELNNGLIEANYAGVIAKFKTSSPFDYHHIRIGSQFENRFFKILFTRLKEGMVIYDIGASIGMYTIPFAKKVGHSGKVYAFEPTKKGIDNIKQNLVLNEIHNVVTYPCAISDQTSEASFYIRPDKQTHSLFEKTLASSKTGKQESIKVKTFTIDDLIEKKISLPPNFIKIDTEGAEIKVLDGIKKIHNHLDLILVEIHKTALKLENIFNPEILIENKLKKIGFTKFEYLSSAHLLASKK